MQFFIVGLFLVFVQKNLLCEEEESRDGIFISNGVIINLLKIYEEEVKNRTDLHEKVFQLFQTIITKIDEREEEEKKLRKQREEEEKREKTTKRLMFWCLSVT